MIACCCLGCLELFVCGWFISAWGYCVDVACLLGRSMVVCLGGSAWHCACVWGCGFGILALFAVYVLT